MSTNSKIITRQHERGFTAVELLITLFIAALFLASGYTLYDAILNRSSEARWRATADTIAYNYLRQYEAGAADPCVSSTPLADEPISSSVADRLEEPTVTVFITCPVSAVTNLTKISVIIEYGDAGDRQNVQHDLFATPSY